MTYAIVFSSRTGNTRKLAERARARLGERDCAWFGGPSDLWEGALDGVDVVLLGSWTDKGGLDPELSGVAAALSGRRVFLFGTCGYGGDPAYYARILENFRSALAPGAEVVGTYLCQGQMPPAVRERYLLMAERDPERFSPLIENFDRAQGHPSEDDLVALDAALVRAGLAS